MLGRFFGEVSRRGHSRATLHPLLSSILFVNSHVNRVDRLGAPKLALHPQAQCIRHLLLVCAARRALGSLRNKGCFTLWSQFVLETHEAAGQWIAEGSVHLPGHKRWKTGACETEVALQSKTHQEPTPCNKVRGKTPRDVLIRDVLLFVLKKHVARSVFATSCLPAS